MMQTSNPNSQDPPQGMDWQLLNGWDVTRCSPSAGLILGEISNEFLHTAMRAGVPYGTAGRLLEGVQLAMVNLGLIYRDKNVPFKVIIKLFLRLGNWADKSIKGWSHFMVEHLQPSDQDPDAGIFHQIDVFVYQE